MRGRRRSQAVEDRRALVMEAVLGGATTVRAIAAKTGIAYFAVARAVIELRDRGDLFASSPSKRFTTYGVTNAGAAAAAEAQRAKVGAVVVRIADGDLARLDVLRRYFGVATSGEALRRVMRERADELLVSQRRVDAFGAGPCARV